MLACMGHTGQLVVNWRRKVNADLFVVSLTPAKDVEIGDSHYRALSSAPWMQLEFEQRPPRGCWVEMTFASSLLDPLTRPVIRFISKYGHQDEILPGAMLGRGIWLGYIPEHTVGVWISPTNRPGPFGFTIQRIVRVPTSAVLRNSIDRSRFRSLKGLSAKAIGLPFAAYREFRGMLGPKPLADYEIWRKERWRALDLNALDSPRSDWREGVQIKLLMFGSSATASNLLQALAELSGQPYPNWTLVFIVSNESERLTFEQAIGQTVDRIALLDDAATISAAVAGMADRDLVIPIGIGDAIPDYTLAVLAEAAVREASAEIFYGDAELATDDGRILLQAKPDWDPIFYSESETYFADGGVFRVGLLRKVAHDAPATLLLNSPDALIKRAQVDQLAVNHIRRVLRRRRVDARQSSAHGANRRTALALAAADCSHAVSIIIPTRDKIGLLRRCIETLQQRSQGPHAEIIVVDNGSRLRKSLDFFEHLKRDENIRVLASPGPFNFSQLCNQAASQANSPVLVFLNNDIEIISENWLEPLVYWVTRRDVGAAGPKLLYPNQLVQHAGVTLGICGTAGHFERLVRADDPGYFGRLRHAHEVSAVTGACLAIEKRKFELVGGFDAANLPVDLNDVDLCLRLSELGYKIICEPGSVLMHRESASRGGKIRAEEFYKNERTYFRARWLHKLRDDPYFHPALSLDTHEAALG